MADASDGRADPNAGTRTGARFEERVRPPVAEMDQHRNHMSLAVDQDLQLRQRARRDRIGNQTGYARLQRQRIGNTAKVPRDDANPAS